jgi:hypothetical protein
MPKSDRWPSILGQIRNPLVFFSLALLVIEAIIGTVVATSKMSGGYQFAAICIMAGLFLAVVAAVTVITIRWPQHLYEDIVKDIKSARKTAQLLESDAFRDAVERILDLSTTESRERPRENTPPE